jgi:hypothetical protein
MYYVNVFAGEDQVHHERHLTVASTSISGNPYGEGFVTATS